MGIVIGREWKTGELRETFAGKREVKLMQGVMALLDMRLMEGAVEALDETLGEFGRGKRLGKMEGMMELKQELCGLMEEEET